MALQSGFLNYAQYLICELATAVPLARHML